MRWSNAQTKESNTLRPRRLPQTMRLDDVREDAGVVEASRGAGINYHRVASGSIMIVDEAPR
jgi:hypothetical protein